MEICKGEGVDVQLRKLTSKISAANVVEELKIAGRNSHRDKTNAGQTTLAMKEDGGGLWN